MGKTMGFILGTLLLAGPASGEVWRFGVALEGQMLPFGLTVFAERQEGDFGIQGRIGWDLFGSGVFLGSEGLWQPSVHSRYALGLLLYPGVGQVAKDLNFTGFMLFPSVGMRRENSGWGHLGAGLPLRLSFYNRTGGDWGFLALLRTRLEVVRAKNP